MIVAFAYTVFNFVLCVSVAGDGNADVVGGQYVVASHGRVLSHLSVQEYHRHRAFELRIFSGIRVTFCLAAVVYFFLWKEEEQSYAENV